MKPVPATGSQPHIMTLLRRFMVLVALMFWQGGFIFYAAVVVPLGQEMFGTQQGFLTRDVTDYLNLSGGLALLVLAWDALAVPDVRWRRGCRWAAWTAMLAGLAALVWLHPHMDRYLNFERTRIVDRSAFRYEHRWYLWISTAQWAASVAYILLMLSAWRRQDQGEPGASATGVIPH